jgi:hypothetical protein
MSIPDNETVLCFVKRHCPRQHAGDVCVLAAGIVAAEAAKGFAAARDPVLFDACEAAIEPIVDGWNDLTGHGYCRFALQGVLQEVEDALQGSQDVEDTFAARGREVRGFSWISFISQPSLRITITSGYLARQSSLYALYSSRAPVFSSD